MEEAGTQLCIDREGLENSEHMKKNSAGMKHRSPLADMEEEKALDLLMDKYGTNRAYTRHYLKHITACHLDNPNFDLYLDSELGSLKRSRSFLKSLSESLGDQGLFRGTRCLDIGCAAGNSLIAFVEEGAAQATGIEIDRGRYETALINIDGCDEEVRDRIRILHSDIESDEITDIGRFDVTFCNDVLEHVRDPEWAIGQICRLMKSTEGAFAFVNLRNYLNPANVMTEPHYGMPAMVLLPPELAAEYYNLCRVDTSLPYEVRYWMSFDEYRSLFETQGKQCAFYCVSRPDESCIDHIEYQSRQVSPAFRRFCEAHSVHRTLKETIEDYIGEYVLRIARDVREYRARRDEALLLRFYLNYVVFDIVMIITNKEVT